MATVVDERALVPEPSGDGDDFLPDDFALLDIYDEKPASLGQARPDALATISAGERVYRDERDKVGFPRVSRDGTIFLHDPDGRAPGLAAALKATEGKSLTVAFAFNDMRLFWQERFARYSQTRLEVYGDEFELREIIQHPDAPPEHKLYLPSQPEYDALRKTCKVSTSLYFALAHWEGSQPRIIFPDGLGLYRLRTTSRHSRRSLLGTFQTASKFTGGQIAGLPFELRLTYREVPDPGGMKRTVPIWSLLFKPPHQIALTSKTWSTLRDAALAEGRVLATAQPALAPPQPENWRMAEAEPDVLVEPSDAELQQLLDGDSPADEEFWRRTWFAVVDHTIFSQDVARHKFIERYTKGATASLSGFLAHATNAQAEAMIRAAVDELKMASAVGAPDNIGSKLSAEVQQRAKRYEEIYGGEDKPLNPTPQRQEPAPALDYTPEPTPFDDVEAEPPVDEADGFYPDPEPEDAPADADIRAHSEAWLAEVHRLIAQAHAHGGAVAANGAQQRIIANLLVQATEGDVGAASKLLKALTKDAPGTTSSAKGLTKAQAEVLQGLAARDEWGECVGAVLRYA